MEVKVYCDQCHAELTESPRGADIYVDTDCSCRDAARKAAKDEGFDDFPSLPKLAVKREEAKGA